MTIHGAQARRQSSGQVRAAFIRTVNDETPPRGGALRPDRGQQAPNSRHRTAGTGTVMVSAEPYRSGGEWKLRAVGQGWQGGLKAVCDTYALQLS